MSEFSIKQYQNEVEKIIHFGDTKKETAIRNAFYNLLNEYASQKGLMLVTEISIKAGNSSKMVMPDGTLKDEIPREAWSHKMGNLSALEWILDQYKGKKPKDPTIAEKFNTYKFSDYKTQVIGLLKRVCTVSVETMKVIEEMNEQEQ
jgi:predicted helicase